MRKLSRIETQLLQLQKPTREDFIATLLMLNRQMDEHLRNERRAREAAIKDPPSEPDHASL